LLSPAPGDTVSSIALASGFVNLGKFAMRYRAAYGEVPSLTLGRTRSLP
jgi:transcriptional regulator GlxA family with amidase domain